LLTDGSIKIWIAQTGENTLTLSGHNAFATGFVFSDDESRILTTSTDKTAKVWDAKTGAELYTLAGHNDTVTSADWLPDGLHIATTSDDGTIKVWRAWGNTQDLIDYAKTCCVIRDLTADERAQFGLNGAAVTPTAPS
jgi:WD40 repeat protein